MLTDDEQRARRDRWNEMEPSPSGDPGWRLVHRDGDRYVEIQAYGGATPGPTWARVCRYGPRGGCYPIVQGDIAALELQRRLIDLADAAIHRYEWGR